MSRVANVVALLARAWIEMYEVGHVGQETKVALLARAWIEINKLS